MSARTVLPLTLACLLLAAPAWAAFPTVAATASSFNNTNTTTQTVSLPSGIASGHLLIVLVSCVSNAQTITWPAGWTELFSQDVSTTQTVEAAYRVADGTEGSTISVSTPGSTACGHLAYRITGQHASSAPEDGAPATGTSTTPDPPSLTASWGAEDNLWIAVFGSYNASNPAPPSAPTDYNNNFIEVSEGASDARTTMGMGTRNLNTATENPGTFTQPEAAGHWVANTIVVRPASVSVRRCLLLGVC